jgi:metal-responsive CopG/Arc/MetJ family transcriptional regulator
MAKVMISMPDALLERIAAHVSTTGESRSGFLQRLAERAIVEESTNRSRELEALLGPPVPMGGDAVHIIREDRESH